MVSAMVGRLPALKYLFAASSYGCQNASAGCRQDTSAWVWTSIATRSLTFIASTPGFAQSGGTAPLARQSAPALLGTIAFRGPRTETAAFYCLAGIVLP